MFHNTKNLFYGRNDDNHPNVTRRSASLKGAGCTSSLFASDLVTVYEQRREVEYQIVDYHYWATYPWSGKTSSYLTLGRHVLVLIFK